MQNKYRIKSRLIKIKTKNDHLRDQSGLSWLKGSVGSGLLWRFPVELMKSSLVIFFFLGESVIVSRSSWVRSARFDKGSVDSLRIVGEGLEGREGFGWLIGLGSISGTESSTTTRPGSTFSLFSGSGWTSISDPLRGDPSLMEVWEIKSLLGCRLCVLALPKYIQGYTQNMIFHENLKICSLF